MIAEIRTQWYDVEGRKVFRPAHRRHSNFHPTFPMGRFLSQPLKHWCGNISEIRVFLSGCKYVSDQEQFAKPDYWQPPELFEESKKGDCEDFALWTWRQLQHLNYPTRFVVGRSGRYGEGHAWLTFEQDGKNFLLEPQAWPAGLELPQLSAVRSEPMFSVSWDGEKVSYFEHSPRTITWSFVPTGLLVIEWFRLLVKIWIEDSPLTLAAKARLVQVGFSEVVVGGLGDFGVVAAEDFAEGGFGGLS